MDAREEKQRSKVLVMASKWARSRAAKHRATEEERRRAESRHYKDGNELAEAVERLEKGWGDGSARAGPAGGST
ncbi:hypothetical protein HH212_00055 [Massilia forsythiae]|uniref:Uncharacterized protein n=1 Tax=Massilia forsythiae TaxID=2728020 RepID=A0A7Z2ZQN5_9BURK|nr:hypothetical protein [Massilia forsythiae]QJD98630.1 hypothetical protein HH212_00055 [Massilia forsythiae]